MVWEKGTARSTTKQHWACCCSTCKLCWQLPTWPGCQGKTCPFTPASRPDAGELGKDRQILHVVYTLCKAIALVVFLLLAEIHAVILSPSRPQQIVDMPVCIYHCMHVQGANPEHCVSAAVPHL